MSLFNAYKILVSRKGVNDYWDDLALYEARDILSDFKEEDWVALLKEWSIQSPLWQEGCAETLSEVETKYSIRILCEMLNSDNETIAEVAVDSLADFSRNYLKSTLNLAQLVQIKLLAERKDFIGMVLSRLITEISKS